MNSASSNQPAPQPTRRQALIRGGQTVGAAALALVGGKWLYDDQGDAGLVKSQPVSLKNYFAGIDYPASAGRLSIARDPKMNIDRMVQAAVEGLDKELGIKRFIKKGDVVLIKPNVGFERAPRFGATTNPQVVGSVIRLVRQAGAREILVADNPIEQAAACFHRSKIRQAAEREGAKVVLPAEVHFQPAQIRSQTPDPKNHEVLASWPVFWKPLAQADKVIGIAPVKDHNLCSASMGMKNWYGLFTCLLAGDSLNRRLVQRRWHNMASGYELCSEAESKYQNLAIGQRQGQYTLYSDGHVAVDFPDPYTFIPLAHFWMCQHPSPKNVLVLGGGAEGLLAEILKHPLEQVDYLEADARQIEVVKPFLEDADLQALKDSRVNVHHLDTRYFVKTQRNRFDLVIARVPEPTSALRARLFTDEFYGELRKAMTDKAVLCMTAYATPSNLTRASANYLSSIRATLRRHFPEVVIGWGDQAPVLAATAKDLYSTDPAELIRRYEERGVKSKIFLPVWFDGGTDWFEPDKLVQRTVEIDEASYSQISTDLRPAVYMQRLELWEQMAGGPEGGGGRVLRWLRSINLVQLAGLLILISAATLYFYYCRGRLDPGGRTFGMAQGTVTLSVATTGFATMALSIVWLFAFQNLYGYVYQRIGWIIAIFMGGLVVGCALLNKPARRCLQEELLADPPPSGGGSVLWRWLIIVDLLLVALSLSVPFVLPVLGSMQTTPAALLLVEIAVSIMVGLTGVLGGAAFALAGNLQIVFRRQVGSAAASVDSADHAGACAGALLTGVLLVPIFGMTATAGLLVSMKLLSAILLVWGGKLYSAQRPGPA